MALVRVSCTGAYEEQELTNVHHFLAADDPAVMKDLAQKMAYVHYSAQGLYCSALYKFVSVEARVISDDSTTAYVHNYEPWRFGSNVVECEPSHIAQCTTLNWLDEDRHHIGRTFQGAVPKQWYFKRRLEFQFRYQAEWYWDMMLFWFGTAGAYAPFIIGGYSAVHGDVDGKPTAEGYFPIYTRRASWRRSFHRNRMNNRVPPSILTP